MVDSTEASSAVTQPADTFASGRYSKRKRTQITYAMQELEISDDESDFEKPSPKVRVQAALDSVFCVKYRTEPQDCRIVISSPFKAQDLSLPEITRGDPHNDLRLRSHGLVRDQSCR